MIRVPSHFDYHAMLCCHCVSLHLSVRVYARYGEFVITRLTLDIAYLCTKYDDSSFSSLRDMIGAPQNLNGSCDLT